MKYLLALLWLPFLLNSCDSNRSNTGDLPNENKAKASLKLFDSAVHLSLQGSDSINREKQLSLLDTAINLDSTNSGAYNYKIQILFYMGRFKKTIRAIDRFDPHGKRADLQVLKGIIYSYHYKDTTLANDYYIKALNIQDSLCAANPSKEIYPLNRAFTILLLKGKEKGMEAFDSLIKKYPKDTTLLRT